MIPEIALAAALTVGPMSVPVGDAADLTPAQEAYRDCVEQRESRGQATARSSRSSASGLYQFLDSKWRRGLSYMVADRLKEFGYPVEAARQLRRDLAATPIHRWHPRYQRVGFAAALNAEGPWSGAFHWSLPGSSCERLVPR